MRLVAYFALCSHVALALMSSLPVRAEGIDDLDALALESAPVEDVTGKDTRKLFVEGALGTANQRFESGSQGLSRASVDFFYSTALTPGWRGVVSDRIDYIRPRDASSDATVNSLREAYLTWQQSGGSTIFEFGRINMRFGPAYGYNPTDYFRDGSLRTEITVNPLAIRENRLGVVAVRGQRLWSDGSFSLAVAPKLGAKASADGSSLALGATNNRARALATFNAKISERVNGQVHIYKERGLPRQLGASLTALWSNATVAYAEWSRGREPDLLSRAFAQPATTTKRNRFAGGLTYTTSRKLSVTGEYQYNGFALDRSGWNSAAASSGVPALKTYLMEALRRQDLASRGAYFIYATQESVGLNNLDLIAMLRVNADDHSRLGWVELRYHWSRVELAIQIQQQSGRSTSEYGLAPYRRSAQILAAYYL